MAMQVGIFFGGKLRYQEFHFKQSDEISKLSIVYNLFLLCYKLFHCLLGVSSLILYNFYVVLII